MSKSRAQTVGILGRASPSVKGQKSVTGNGRSRAPGDLNNGALSAGRKIINLVKNQEIKTDSGQPA